MRVLLYAMFLTVPLVGCSALGQEPLSPDAQAVYDKLTTTQDSYVPSKPESAFNNDWCGYLVRKGVSDVVSELQRNYFDLMARPDVLAGVEAFKARCDGDAQASGLSTDAQKVLQTLKGDSVKHQTCPSYLELGLDGTTDWVTQNYDISFANIDQSDVETGVGEFLKYCRATN